MLIWGHLVKGLETVWVLDSAEFGNVCRALGVVSRRSISEQGTPSTAAGEEVGAFGDGATDQNSSRRLAPDTEMRSRGVFGVDEVLSSGNEIAPGIRLGQFFTSQMPPLAELAAAAHMGDGKHAATLEPGHVAAAEGGREGVSIGAVANERRRCCAVTDQTSLVDNG